MDFKNEADEIRALGKILEDGYVYRGLKPVNWCFDCGSALAEAEVEYQDKEDLAVDVGFAFPSDQLAAIAKAFSLNQLPKSEGMAVIWTTTPWTLPSNTALAVGKDITYILVKTFNAYTHELSHVILAKDLIGKYFPEANAALSIEEYKKGDKAIPYVFLAEFKGSELDSICYEQLLPYAQPTDSDAFRVVLGDFVTTTDGTGIVHIAPSFGADDFRVAKQNGIGALTLVDKAGKFVDEVNDPVFPLQGRYVKEAYYTESEKEAEFKLQHEIMRVNNIISDLKSYMSADDLIVLKLKLENSQ
jgi:isoleucyl-tRNA synthetase